jgi:hypothetical protein
MKIDDVYILEEAVDDLNEGRSFYDIQETGVGDYFWDCLIADIESLIIYAGVHRRKLGFYQMFAKRFPYAIYYEIIEKIAYVVAILPMRRDPVWISEQLKGRR